MAAMVEPSTVPVTAPPPVATPPAAALELTRRSAVDQRRLIAERAVSATELLEAHLAVVQAVNPAVNAVVGMDAEVARHRAADVDRRLAAGDDPGLLAGLVTAHKDLTETADFVTTYGSAVFAGNRPAADSLLVARMKEAGAVAIGKTNTPEFGAGSHSFNPVYGVTRNPFDLGRSAGGSSGGAAAALRCGMVAVADGSDAGGSLRNPAAWNNVVGFRSSSRLVPRVGPGNAWSVLSIEGPMARSVDDLALLLRVIGRPDLRDPLSRDVPVPDPLAPADGPLRVAWSPTLGGLPVESDVAGVLQAFVGQVEMGLGWRVAEDEPSFDGADEVFLAIRAFAFAAGIGEGLGDERLAHVKETVRGEVARGRAMTAMEVARAQTRAAELWRRACTFFERYDVLIGPVTQISPFPVSQEWPTEVAGQPINHYIDWMLSNCRISAFGLPALSLPAGFTDAGLPVGAQIIGPPHGDLAVLRAAKALEAATNYGSRWPLNQ